jgi:hypothetical protein
MGERSAGGDEIVVEPLVDVDTEWCPHAAKSMMLGLTGNR